MVITTTLSGRSGRYAGSLDRWQATPAASTHRQQHRSVVGEPGKESRMDSGYIARKKRNGSRRKTHSACEEVQGELERYTQGHLNLARALLHIDDLPELGIPDRGYGVTESAPVEGVEHIGAELDVPAFPEGETLEYAEVFRWLIGASKVAEVARRGAQPGDHAIRRRRGVPEGVGVEILYAGPAGDVEVPGGADGQWLTGNHVRANPPIEEIPAAIDAGTDRQTRR